MQQTCRAISKTAESRTLRGSSSRAGLSVSGEEILKEFPDLEPQDIHACLSFAARKLDHPVVVP